MRSKLHDSELLETRRGSKPENSPVRPGSTRSSNASRVSGGGRGSGGRVSGGASQSPAAGGGAGRTPQTKRRELSLSVQLEKNSPNGSPRNVNRTSSVGNTRKSGNSKAKSEVNNEESSRKSSNSSQDSGIGRESKLSRPDRTKSSQNLTKSKVPPIITTSSPDKVENEVSGRKRFEELCDIKNIELGMVKVPPDILEDLINKEKIEKSYDVDEVPVAR